MLPQYYHKCISQLLTQRQYVTLRITVLILQSYRTIQIEKLASILPIPIKYESRRRHLQRFLVLPQLSTKCMMLLNKKGNSNIAEQKRLLKSTLRLLKGYQVVVIGDREFGKINLADWLSKQGCQYVLRTKSNKYIQQEGEEDQQLISLGLKPGKSFYLKQVRFTKQTGMSRVNLAFYWSKITSGKRKNEGWYLINNGFVA